MIIDYQIEIDYEDAKTKELVERVDGYLTKFQTAEDLVKGKKLYDEMIERYSKLSIARPEYHKMMLVNDVVEEHGFASICTFKGAMAQIRRTGAVNLQTCTVFILDIQKKDDEDIAAIQAFKFKVYPKINPKPYE